jgi:GxxExxY protein
MTTTVRNKTGELLYGELAEKLIGYCYEIQNQYSSGHKEKIYQDEFEEVLTENSIPYKREVSIRISSERTGKVFGIYRLDFVVNEMVVVEIKAIRFTLKKLEQQLYSYLRNSPYKVGSMVNFGSCRFYVERMSLT